MSPAQHRRIVSAGASPQSFSGRTALITGATSGVGRSCAMQLAEAGAHVLLGCRDTEKGKRVAEEIRRDVGSAEVELLEVDLSDLSSVETAAGHLLRARRDLHLLVNNAALAAIPRAETTDGFEMQIRVAHFGHFALTALLLPLVLQTPSSRIVTVTSSVANRPHIDLDDLQSSQHYRRYRAYRQAKVANLLFAVHLHDRLQSARSGTASVAAQPGWTRTNLGPGRSAPAVERVAITVGNRLFGHEPEIGAQPILLACSDHVPSGSFVTRSRLNGLRGRPLVVDRRQLTALDDWAATELWKRSEQLTGINFPELGPIPSETHRRPGTSDGSNAERR